MPNPVDCVQAAQIYLNCQTQEAEQESEIAALKFPQPLEIKKTRNSIILVCLLTNSPFPPKTSVDYMMFILAGYFIYLRHGFAIWLAIK